ncbi:GNAT family N-acetyltransferase [Furfurilactobacillus sp. WILCCON 0119]|uniref:GNAT family N-acetyltransferase n=1 Tax=Furfurilactobacillus entadae TaxID=2922307 RepID=UPI0035EA18FD
MSQITIRPATVADYPRLEQIYLVARQRAFPWVHQPRLTDFDRDSRGELILVAELNQQVVGFTSFYRLASFIHLLFVDPAFHHQHVGTALIGGLRTIATEPLQLKVVIQNEAARAFYAHHHFRETKRDVLATPPNITLEDTRLDQYPNLGRHATI